MRALAAADVVFHDALVEPDVLALAPEARKIAVGKRCGAHSTSQRFINKRLVDAALAGDDVVRLKGGDPMIFGRAHEEIEALVDAGIDVEVVPGVAALAAAAAGRMSLTRRGVARSVAFVTPRVGDGEGRYVGHAAAVDTAVLYMAAADAGAVVEALVAAGVPPQRPVGVFENAARPGQRILRGTLADLPATRALEAGGLPVLIAIGDVCDVLPLLAASPSALRRTPSRILAGRLRAAG